LISGDGNPLPRTTIPLKKAPPNTAKQHSRRFLDQRAGFQNRRKPNKKGRLHIAA
jgi:hypothetical protein